MQRRKTLQDPWERNARFEPRDGHAGARMSAGGEREVSIRTAGDVEAVRIRKFCGIAICRANAEREIGARLERHVAQGDALDDEAVAELIGTFVAQALFDRRGDESSVIPQPLEFAGMREQEVQGVPIRFVVVSWPALRRNTQLWRSSPSVSGSGHALRAASA